MHPLQIEKYRRMTIAEKLDALAEMYWLSRGLLATGTRMRHPDWTPEQIEEEVRIRMLHGAP